MQKYNLFQYTPNISNHNEHWNRPHVQTCSCSWDKVFTKLFDQAEIAKYTPEERREYEASVKNYWDYNSTVDTAHRKGIKEGKEIGRAEGIDEANRENARKMKVLGIAVDVIVQVTGLTAEEIQGL